MHTIFHTDAFVLAQYPSRESNKSVVLFTRDLGLITVHTQGIRKSTAKLSSHVIDYALIRADIVKGRGVWRMISAKVVTNTCMGTSLPTHARGFVRALSLVQRFVGSEMVQPELFYHIMNCAEHVDDETLDAKKYDTIALWKSMAILGYVSLEGELETIYTLPLVEAIRILSDDMMEELISTVNTSIVQSHL